MICLHHDDLDGRCSAAIVQKALGNDNDIKFYEVNYSSELPIDDIKKDEDVIIVDFSLSDDDMKRVEEKTKNITWIDHHKTAEGYYYQHFNGLRNFKDKAKAACELCWDFYFPTKEMPETVQLLGDYDKFALKLKPACFNFHEGMKIEDTTPKSEIWNELLGDGNELLTSINEISKIGENCIKYRDIYYQDMMAEVGYETKYKGLVGCVANLYGFGSPPFGDKIDRYDFIVSYIHNGRSYKVSLYSKKKNVDVSEISKSFGGGGNKGASGFECTELPFKPSILILKKK